MDVYLLSRIQFAVTIGFHYIFPPMSIGLGLILVIMEGMYLKTRAPVFQQMTRFFVRIFGLIFALGVASGIVMEFQFGTNWATYSRYVGDVFGSALAAEGIFAFFLESGFLALLLFGWDRVGPKTHFFSTVMVSLGAHFSAIWIVVANSWMQTPAGFHIVQHGATERAEIVDFWAMLFNPSTMDRISHVYMGAWQVGAFFVLSVTAYYILKKRHVELAKTAFKIALVVAAFSSVGQLLTGHSSAIGVAQNQPAKLAAFEGHYPANEVAPVYLFGWVNEDQEQVQFGIKFPKLLSFLVHGDFETPVPGLRAFAPENRPPVNIVFQTYHLMVLIGSGLIGLAWLGIILLRKGAVFKQEWLLWIFVFSVIGPHIANQVGWMTAEIGRQPYIVHNLLRTSEAFSKAISAGEVLTSLILFGLIYIFLFTLFIYLLNDKIQHGPLDEDYVVEGHRA